VTSSSGEKMMSGSNAPGQRHADSRVPMPRPGWEGPIFIVGMPRSGTKLLRGLLDQHPRIRILPAETEFLPFLASWLEQHGRPASEEAFAQMYEAMRGATYFNYRAAARAPFDWRQWRARCAGAYDLGDLFEGFARYELEAPRGSGVIWADKSPAYVRYMPLLLKHFGTARIIHIVRDVRDYCVSNRRAWGKDIRRAAHRWGRDVMRAHSQCKANPQRCFEIRYEDLLQDPESQLRDLCAFLGIEYVAELTGLHKAVEHRGNAAGRTAIVRDNFHRFERHLTPREIAAVESLAWQTMVALGYRPARAAGPRELGAMTEQFLRLKDGVQLLLKDARRRGLAGAIRFHASHRRMT
jgi:Sulfotransferase family